MRKFISFMFIWEGGTFEGQTFANWPINGWLLALAIVVGLVGGTLQ